MARGVRMPGGRRLYVLLVAAASALALGLGAAAYWTDVVRDVELISVDARFDARGAVAPPGEVAVVGIDDKTFDEYESIPYPLPRRFHARVIDRLLDAGARTIVYDIQFTERSSSADDDNALVDAVARARGKIVLATTETDGKGGTRVLGGDDLLREIGARAGNAIVPADPNGVIRRLTRSVDGLGSLPVVATEVATDRPVANFPKDGAWIDFHGPAGTLDWYSFSDVEEGRIPPRAFRGRVVVVGAMAPSLQDVAATSASGDELMSGPEIQAESISTILRGFPLTQPSRLVGWLLTVALGALGVLVCLLLPPLRGLLCAAGLAVAYAGAAYLAFGEGWILPVVAPAITLTAATVAILAVRVLHEAVERRRMRDAFGRFVPESVVDEVLERAGDGLRLGGVRRECTVLFSDLRGFTSFSEGRSPDEVITILNEYLTEMSDAILDSGGTLISYMGDGIMAVFGAPLEQPDHRDRALATAREMLARLERFSARRGTDGGFRMGIGINTGPVMCGNVGSMRRLEYTVIGDTTNTASRLESMTKGSGYDVFVAEATRAGLREPASDLEYVDEFEVRGRTNRIEVWGLRGAGAGPAGREERADQGGAVAA